MLSSPVDISTQTPPKPPPITPPNSPQHTPSRATDFFRPVHCLLGLPVDAISRSTAVNRLRTFADDGSRCLLATPNLNFVAESMRRPEFRDHLLQSDLVTADGMPLVWLARMIGVPITERSSGADLFDALRSPAQGHGPMRVFFFGGEPGIAERAHDRINADGDNLVSVGALFPGHGTAAELSSEEFVDRINESDAAMLVIALGAVKGHAWIDRNLSRLRTPIVSHLGAVVAFAAQQTRRAPTWMREAGLEWLWRTLQEPRLAMRYLRDAWTVAPLVLTRVLPYRLWVLRNRMRRVDHGAAVRVSRHGNTVELGLEGSFVDGTLDELRGTLTALPRSGERLMLLVSKVSHVDSAFIGLVMLLKGQCDRERRELRISGASRRLTRIFKLHCADYLLGVPG